MISRDCGNPEYSVDPDEMPQKAVSLVDFEFTRDICIRKTDYTMIIALLIPSKHHS